jgi:hypothetical protein
MKIPILFTCSSFELISVVYLKFSFLGVSFLILLFLFLFQKIALFAESLCRLHTSCTYKNDSNIMYVPSKSLVCLYWNGRYLHMKGSKDIELVESAAVCLYCVWVVTIISLMLTVTTTKSSRTTHQ